MKLWLPIMAKSSSLETGPGKTMQDFKEILGNTLHLASAIDSLGLTPKQTADLRALYESKVGIPVWRDKGRRVRGDTVNSCSKVGAGLTRYFDGIGPQDQMMWIGYLRRDGDSEAWTMRPEIKLALQSLGWESNKSQTLQSVSEVEKTTVVDWSLEELRDSVLAYSEMQRKTRSGEPFSKKEYYRALSKKFGRSEKAFEYRMQNISFVLTLMGRQWLDGLMPAKNVGAKTAEKIERLICEVHGQNFEPTAGFEITVREKQKEKTNVVPLGQEQPKSALRQTTSYQRDAAVKAWVLKEAKGKCECCSRQAPFHGSDGEPFLEVHHLRRLAEGGSDRVFNAVAICPNCHRNLHHGINAKELRESMYGRITRLVKE